MTLDATGFEDGKHISFKANPRSQNKSLIAFSGSAIHPGHAGLVDTHDQTDKAEKEGRTGRTNWNVSPHLAL
jgi:hypothetical protein